MVKLLTLVKFRCYFSLAVWPSDWGVEIFITEAFHLVSYSVDIN